ncbi:hypothetical protein [Pseudoalteromonas sp. H71]|uniref:hypothetical protein n=1 Tax=Pseudoalteromonas sp. H71 TaxID=1348395 RepID=UPI0007300D7E|nr:hypothetical protein [Pseudoalteromonas sp. H71]KTD88863.1 hypothetical protein ATS71_10525 [Pseudoalteromonas sp. H71]
MKILFLQQKEYFSELGVEFKGYDATFGCIISFNIYKNIAKYDLVVSCIDHDKDARKIIEAANRIAIPTVFLMDGVYDITNAKENPLLRKLGVKLLEPFIYANIFVLGESFVSYLQGKHDVNAIDYLPLRASLNIENTKNISDSALITTAITPYFNQEERKTLIIWLKKVIAVLTKHSISYETRIFDRNILNELSIDESLNRVSCSLSDAIGMHKNIICTPSTVIHSLSKYNVNNLCLNFRKEALLYNTNISVNDLANIESSILKLIDDDYDSVLDGRVNIGVNLLEHTYKTFKCDNSGIKNNKFYFSVNFFLRTIYKKMPNKLAKKIKKIITR